MYKIGDKVRVINNLNRHDFKINTIVELVSELYGNWLCRDNIGNEWMLTEIEFSKISDID